MVNPDSFILNLSILYRNTQKYFDHVLEKYDIGSGQLIFLLFINEHEGVTMQEVTHTTQVDKGTTTKSVNRLIEQGYVQARQDEKDKRVKRLYTTEKAAGIMNTIYEARNHCRNVLAQDIDFSLFEKMLAKAGDASSEKLILDENEDFTEFRIGGMQKVTLLDYPEKAACTIFTAGCNLKCPFCHNKDLVFLPENYSYFDPQEILSYLQKRQGILDGVVISGGEPLLQKGLDFVRTVKEMGYLVKLDTNGSFPDLLKEYVESGLIDYVAMDIKNCREKYAKTCGMSEENFKLRPFEESVSYLLEGHVDYEFRTTVVKELHTKEDLLSIAKWIKGAKRYYLQQFVDSGNIIGGSIYSAYNEQEMKELCEAVQMLVPVCKVRGVK